MDTLDRLSLDPVPPPQRPGRARSGRRTAVLALVVMCGLAAVAVVNSRRHDHRPAAVVSAPAPVTVSSGLSCGSAPGAAVVRDADVSFHTPRGRPLRLLAWRCTDALGTRYPSLVQVLDASPGGPDRAAVARATLIPVDRDFHLSSVVLDVDGDSAFATGIVGAGATRGGARGSSGPGSGPAGVGAMVRLSFHTADDQTWTARSVVGLAAPCQAADLTVSARTNRPDGTSAVVTLTNTASSGCAVEGYPTVRSWQGAVAGPTAHQAFTAGTGAATSAPPVLLVPAHGQVRAVVDSGGQTPAGGPTLCTRTDRLTVAPPGQTAARPVAVSLRVCDFRVHPLMAADWPAAGG